MKNISHESGRSGNFLTFRLFAVPYTVGMWQKTKPVEISLVKGQNVLNFEVAQGSRGVIIKDFTLTPVK